MQPVNLFELASRQAQWLGVRQATIAGNVANVNTTGYKAMDVEPFEKVLDRSSVSMTATQKGHFGASPETVSFKTRQDTTQTAVMPSQNTVKLETELMKAGEVGRSFELNTAIVKAFNRMLLTSLKT